MAISEVTTEASGKANVDRGATGKPGLNPAPNHLVKAYLLIVCLLSGAAIICFFSSAWKSVVYPYEIDYGEGIVLWQAQHVTHLHTAYAPFSQYPYIVFHYPPLYHLVSFTLSKLTGNLLLAGRTVSFLAAIGICLILALIAYRSVPQSAPRSIAWCVSLVAAALLCGLDSMSWVPLMRVDMFGLLLSYAGLANFVFARSPAQRYISFLLFVAAMFTRQTLISGALACLFVLAILDLRQAVKAAIFTALLGSGILALLTAATNGEFLKHLFLYNQNIFSIGRMITLTAEALRSMRELLLLVAALIVTELVGFWSNSSFKSLTAFRARLTSSPYLFSVFVFTVHLVFAALISLTVGKAGSNINYFLEFGISSCVLVSLLLGRFFVSWTGLPISAPVTLGYLVVLILLSHVAKSTAESLSPESYGRKLLAAKAAVSQALLPIVQHSPGLVMSEDMTLLYLAGKQVPFEPAIVAQNASTGRWDEQPLLNMIRNHAFSVMIINLNSRERYTPAVAQAVLESYRPTKTYGKYTVYLPSQ